MQKLSDFLTNYMKEHDLSGREVARRCDLSPQTIFNICKGVTDKGLPIKIDTKTLVKLTNGLNLYDAHFSAVNMVMYISLPEDREEMENASVSVEPDEEVAEYLEQLRTRPEMRELFQTSRHLTKEQISSVVAMLEGFKKNS